MMHQQLAFFNFKTNIEQHGLKMETIIGESFDGASNMRGGTEVDHFAKVGVHMVLRSCVKPRCHRYGRKHNGSEKFDRLTSKHRNLFFRFMQTNGCFGAG